MSSPFISAVQNSSNYTTTENGARTHITSNNHCVDFFQFVGACRQSNNANIINAWTKAFAEDPLTATKILFYLRDVRGGLGERRAFRVISNYAAHHSPDVLLKNLDLVHEFGRWDDLISLIDTPIVDEVVKLVKTQITSDNASDKPTLLGKWLPSSNTSSKDTRKRAGKLRKLLGMDFKQYQKTFSSLRKKIDILETKISEKNYQNIDYSKIPSKAGLVYRKTFSKNDGTRYSEFLSNVQKGTATINAGTLFPYDIVKKAFNMIHTSSFVDDVKSLQALWDNLPDYTGESTKNAIAVVDVSGSMTGGSSTIAPIHVALSLGLYLAERNTGPFQNSFITFSATPSLQQIIGNNLLEKLNNMNNADWGMNTDIHATFNLILSAAQQHNVSKEDMPSAIFIISDMQFDRCCGNSSGTTFQKIKSDYSMAGYNMPKLIFWNVNAKPNQSPVKHNELGVALVSGASSAIFKTCLSGNTITPYDVMMNTISTDRYNKVKI